MIKRSLFIILIFLASISIAQLSVIDKRVSFGLVVPDSQRTIDVVLLHSSYCISENDSFNLECILGYYRQYDVSAHYIIDREGVIYQLVAEKDISHHGGKGILPDGGTKINTRSIGIELINTKVSSYSDAQYTSVCALVNDIKKRYAIKYILGHSDTAPGRKTDPWNFDWMHFQTELATFEKR